MATSIDIGANLLDGMFQGVYHGKAKHAPDLDRVLSRARSAGLEAVMVTAGNLDESAKALDLARRLNSGGGDDAKSDGGKLDKSSESKRYSERDRPRFLFSTVGVHPTRCLELEKGGDAYLRRLLDLALEGKKSGEVVAIGECGLDYDRLKFCPKDVQLVQFEKQFELAEATGLPMFLHSRNAAADFSRLVRRNRNRFSTGVVHSFTGAWDEAEELIDMGLYIGINGCSLKTQENLDVVAKIPLDRLMVETDAPWCGIRRTHAGYEHVKTTWESVKKEKHVPSDSACVKGRSEPCHIVQVLEVVAARRGLGMQELAAAVLENTRRVFFPASARVQACMDGTGQGQLLWSPLLACAGNQAQREEASGGTRAPWGDWESWS